jgi:hypothetical protein
VIAVLLAVLAAVGAVGFVATASLRAYRRSTPRYAAPQPLLAQGGVAGRAAVLGAPSTHRALVLLELKSALEEALAHRLGLPPTAGPALIFEAIEQQHALSARSTAELRRLLTELAKAENAVATSRALKVSEQSVERTRQRVLAILSELSAPEDSP